MFGIINPKYFLHNTARGMRPAVLFALTAVVTADWLFPKYYLGLATVFFFVVLAAGVWVCRYERASARRHILGLVTLVFSLLPMLEDTNLVSVLIGFFGLGFFSLLVGKASVKETIFATPLYSLWLCLSGPFLFVRALDAIGSLARRAKFFGRLKSAFASLLLPILFCVVFLTLFYAANPVIEFWLSQIQMVDLDTSIGRWRALFWLVIFLFSWSYFRSGYNRQPFLKTLSSTSIADDTEENTDFSPVGVRTVINSLLLFNAIFLIQTGLDCVYLWGGGRLPDGMTYSNYAHRGAYPLIATVLISAFFLLYTMRPGGDVEASRLVRLLVVNWIVQNMLLVLSAVQRLNLYVEVYSLTYFRLAAFIWMFLIATGLLLILLRMLLRKSNNWLIVANCVVLAATIYVCSFVNFPHVIAEYNIVREDISARYTVDVDVNYLCRLGIHAYPAAWELLPKANNPYLPSRYAACSLHQKAAFLERTKNWRSWSFRNHRLREYLKNAVSEVKNSATEAP